MRYTGNMKKAFTLIELMVVLGILGILGTIVLVAVLPARVKSRDSLRQSQLNLIGRYLTSASCYAPDAGPGDYDLKEIFDEIVSVNEEVAKFLTSVPKDPRLGSETASGFRYLYDVSGHCALYANLERDDTEVTLPSLSEPTAGGGRGVLEASSAGPNGSDKYYQISK